MEGRRFDRDRLIRHNLDRFLEPKEGPLSPWETAFCSAPLFPFAIAFIAGICLQAQLPFPVWSGIALSVFSMLVFASALFLPRCSPRSIFLCFGAAIAVFIAAGMLRYAAFAAPSPNPIAGLAGTERRLATLEGVIVSSIRRDDRAGWVFAQYFPTPPQSSFYLSVRSLLSSEGPIAASGTVRVQVGEIARHLQEGDLVRLYCWLEGFDGAANPGQFDMRAYMHQRGVLLGASVPAADGVEILARGQGGWMAAVRQRLKNFADGALFEDADYPDESAALATALLLGQRSDMDAKTYAAYQRTGLAHFISLSGMHVGILAGSLWGLSRFLGLSKPMRAVVCLVLLLCYGLVVPPRAPTLRAIFLACFFFSAVLINRRTRPLNTLALSAIVLLLVRPADLFSASWQLSFSTVLGIILLYGPIYERLASWTVFKAVEVLPERYTKHPAVQVALAGSDSIVKLLSVGLSAWLGGAGFLLYHFCTVNPLSSVWTVLATPFVLMILYAGYLKVALATVFPTAAMLCGLALDAGCRGLNAVVQLFAQVRWSEIAVGRISALAIIAEYAVLLLARFAPRRAAVRIFSAAMLLGTFGAWRHFQTHRNELTVTCLSVGHGQAVCISFPDRSQWLVDAGSISQKDPGGRTVLPYLRHQGVAALDAVILTHGDMDHLNGLPEVISVMPTRGVYANAGVFQKSQLSSSASYLEQCLQEAKTPLEPIEAIRDLPAGVEVRMLWPDLETARNAAIEDNNKSQVLRIEYAGRSILLCGDIEQYAQDAILERYPSVRADVIVLPHHGSTTNLDAGFVAAFEPKIVIASCAAGRVGNAFVPEAGRGVEAFYTPADGAVTVNTKADGTLCAIGFKSQKTVRLE